MYHAVLKDHPELFWVHNREKVYKTTYSGRDYCHFSPGYTYTEAQRQEIMQAMENAYQEVLSQIPDGADDYTKVMTVYTYVIDNTEYVISDDDQSIAGDFWKKQAICAGYAGAVQYLLDILLQGSSHEKQQLLNGKEVTALGEAIERCKEAEEAA